MKRFLFLLLTATLIATACKPTPKTATPEDLAAQAADTTKNGVLGKIDTVTKELPFDNSEKDLAGKWQDNSDANNVVEFKDKTFIESYGGQKVHSAPYTYDKTCKDCAMKDGKPSDGCFVTREGAEIYCYRIASKSSSTLEYSLVGSTGKVHSFKKVK